MNDTTKAAPIKESPRYRLLEKAYLSGVRVKKGGQWMPFDDVLLDPAEMPLAQRLDGPFDNQGGGERVPLEIEFDGIPGPHMEPLNDAARAMAKKFKLAGGLSPVDKLTIMGPDAALVNT